MSRLSPPCHMEQLQIGTRDLPPTTHLRSLSHGTQLEALTVFQEHTAGMHLSHAKSAKSHPREGSSVGVMTYQQHPVRLAARLRILDHTDRHHRHHLHHRHAKERCVHASTYHTTPVLTAEESGVSTRSSADNFQSRSSYRIRMLARTTRISSRWLR